MYIERFSAFICPKPGADPGIFERGGGTAAHVSAESAKSSVCQYVYRKKVFCRYNRGAPRAPPLNPPLETPATMPHDLQTSDVAVRPIKSAHLTLSAGGFERRESSTSNTPTPHPHPPHNTYLPTPSSL